MHPKGSKDINFRAPLVKLSGIVMSESIQRYGELMEMYCPECHYEYKEDDTYCRHCGEELMLPSTSLVTTAQTRLPALQYAQLPRKVAASVGAVALGVGIELLRRNLLTRFTSATRASRSIEKVLPTLGGLNDATRSNRTVKVPKGYIIDETIVYTRRIIRRER
jgi:hypothetical protein